MGENVLMSQSLSPKLVDSKGRWIHKLRLSLLDACNMSCLYCMPSQKIFTPGKKFLTPSEIYHLCKVLTELGIDEVRLTGGEPLLRPDFDEIVRQLSDLHLKKLGLTTNGVQLEEKLNFLSETRLKHINISIDSLNRDNFHAITGMDCLDTVLKALSQAKKLGFNIKVNVVLNRGVNDHEVEDFVHFSSSENVEVRFLEVMKIGVMREAFKKY